MIHSPKFLGHLWTKFFSGLCWMAVAKASRVLTSSLIVIGNEVLNGTVKDKNIDIAVR